MPLSWAEAFPIKASDYSSGIERRRVAHQVTRILRIVEDGNPILHAGDTCVRPGPFMPPDTTCFDVLRSLVDHADHSFKDTAAAVASVGCWSWYIRATSLAIERLSFFSTILLWPSA